MLAVVLLLPIVIMIVACLLERFEAHAVAAQQTPRVRRPLPAAPAVATEPATLALVPGADEGAVGAVTPELVPDTGPRELRRAS